jgi:hypothetical protein
VERSADEINKHGIIDPENGCQSQEKERKGGKGESRKFYEQTPDIHGKDTKKQRRKKWMKKNKQNLKK